LGGVRFGKPNEGKKTGKKSAFECKTTTLPVETSKKEISRKAKKKNITIVQNVSQKGRYKWRWQCYV